MCCVVPSKSLRLWQTVRARELDEIEAAHKAVGGHARGRRYATQQINHAYAVLLSSQFQAYCRDLHSEAVDCLVSAASPVALKNVLQARLTADRKLDHGNPNPGNLGSDFARLGLVLWSEVEARGPRNTRRKERLQELNDWRNAIAHMDFDPAKLGGRKALRLSDVQAFRTACQGLARSFDGVLRDHLKRMVGSWPW